ncbi:MAG: tetratricopeptide repeat protein [Cyclobacteriaceae bacterium]
MKNLTNLLIALCFVACQTSGNQDSSESTSEETPGIEAITMLGDTLYTPTVDSGAAFEQYLAAKTSYENDTNDATALVWYGRRTAYLGRFQNAIAIYTMGIEKFPEDARMYRHRGHRYISTRQYDKAIADFEKAVELIEGTEDQVEPDGLPNARNIPIGTLHSNIWYHLGLAYYLKNDMENALRAYSNRTVTEKYDDNVVSGGHWLYMILRRLERTEEANAAIEKVTKEMDVIENTSYFKMCLFYKGLLTEDELQPDGSSSASDDVLTYSVGNWYLYDRQDPERAQTYFEKILENGNPFSFAYLAAESDWNRLYKN